MQNMHAVASIVFLSVLNYVLAAQPAVKLSYDSSDNAVIENGFVEVIVGKTVGGICSIISDFQGNSIFDAEKNVLSAPISLETKYAHGRTCSSSESAQTSAVFSVIVESEDYVSITLSNIVDCVGDAFVTESWVISLSRGIRSVSLHIEGRTANREENMIFVSHSFQTNTKSIYGLFDQGVAQMMNNGTACLGSDASLPRLYSLGNGRALDILRVHGDKYNWGSDQVVLSTDASAYGGKTGFQNIVLGSYPAEKEVNLEWRECWGQDTVATLVAADTTYAISFDLVANNFDFPSLPMVDMTVANEIMDVPFKDLRSYLTGVYASPAGCLKSYYAGYEGMIAPTVAHPDTGYSPDTNFFDPDNYISLSALLYSGDDYFINQARLVLERTAETMCGLGSTQNETYCDQAGHTGQLMHHFINFVPTYESIAESTQLGPNIFWSLSALEYVAASGDSDWLVKMMPFIDLSLAYMLSFVDEATGLMSVPGPLWIDVLVRENLTSDSNAAAVLVLEKLSLMYKFFDQDDVRYESLQTVKHGIIDGMNEYLWALNQTGNANNEFSNTDDHYITQLNPDGSYRDFVDYDANLLAVAFDVASDERSQKILERVDSGKYTHVRGTWCCEVEYSGDAEDCYIVGGSVCGDSVVTLGRIGWADAHARKRMNDLQTFEELLLVPLQDDLLADTWLFERYDANGTQIRTAFYFEYPSLVTMMLREIRWGIDLEVDAINIDPFPASPFVYHLGSVFVSYDKEAVRLKLPTQSLSKQVNIASLYPTAEYEVSGASGESSSEIIQTNEYGLLSFVTSNINSARMIMAARVVE